MLKLSGLSRLVNSCGSELSGATRTLKSPFLNIIPKYLKTEMLKIKDLVRAGRMELGKWCRRRALVLQNEHLLASLMPSPQTPRRLATSTRTTVKTCLKLLLGHDNLLPQSNLLQSLTVKADRPSLVIAHTALAKANTPPEISVADLHLQGVQR